MGDDWVVLQLRYSEEKVDPALLEAELKSISPGVELFIPRVSYKDRRGSYAFALFDGYAFARGLSEGGYNKLERSSYVRCVLCSSKGKLSYVKDAEVQRLKGNLLDLIPSDFSVGDIVHMEQGLFKGLEAKIIAVEGEKLLVEVYMPMGSLIKLTRVPKIFVAKP